MRDGMPRAARAAAILRQSSFRRASTATSRRPSGRSPPVSFSRIGGASASSRSTPSAMAWTSPLPSHHQHSSTGTSAIAAGSGRSAGVEMRTSRSVNPKGARTRLKSSDVNATSAGRDRHDAERNSGSRPASAWLIASPMSTGSEPWNPKIACLRSPTQTLRRAMRASAETTASCMGEVSWNSSTTTRSSFRPRDAATAASSRSRAARASMSWKSTTRAARFVAA